MSNNWIFEKEAAEKMGIKPDTLRRLVKKGKWNIAITAPNGRNFQYLERDLNRVLNQFSTLTK